MVQESSAFICRCGLMIGKAMNKNPVVIKASHIGKNFHIYKKPQDRVKQIFSLRGKKYYQDFWALKDVSFTVKKGESLGIIGRNGSGKSTLLQILCQTMQPTSGTLEVNGRIAAMLELGAGFNPEFTGKENVYLNGAILGYTRKEMEARYEEIIAFADIGDFIHQPVKTYSSGMFVRLAFAVQAHVSPDILIVDEALSVGDIFFQQKCAKRMREMLECGSSLIFVSHDMGIVRDLCQNVIYLKTGEVVAAGASVDVIQKYYLESNANTQSSSTALHSPKKPLNNHHLQKIKDYAFWINPLSQENLTLNKKAMVVAVAVLDHENIPSSSVRMTEKLKFQILYQSFSSEPVHIAVALRNRYNHIVNVSGTYTSKLQIPVLNSGAFALFELDVTCMLEAGDYTFCVYLGAASEPANRGDPYDETPWLGPVTIHFDYETQRAPWFGMFGLPVEGRFSLAR